MALQPHLALTRATWSTHSLTSSMQSPDPSFSVVTLFGMEPQLFAYAAISITSGRAFTAIAICTVVIGKIFTVFLIVKNDHAVTFAFATMKTGVD